MEGIYDITISFFLNSYRCKKTDEDDGRKYQCYVKEFKREVRFYGIELYNKINDRLLLYITHPSANMIWYTGRTQLNDCIDINYNLIDEGVEGILDSFLSEKLHLDYKNSSNYIKNVGSYVNDIYNEKDYLKWDYNMRDDIFFHSLFNYPYIKGYHPKEFFIYRNEYCFIKNNELYHKKYI